MNATLQKIASYIYPIKIETIFSEYSQQLEIILYRGQHMLCTTNAMYSYGTNYSPFKKAFAYLQQQNKLQTKNFLLLGGGLGSAVQILNSTYQLFPLTTIVEKDEEIMALAYKYFDKKQLPNLQLIVQDALAYVANENQQYDLLGIDIFIDMQVPKQFLEKQFLENCKRLMQKNGIIIMNSAIGNAEKESAFLALFQSVFPNTHIIEHKINKILVAIV